MPNIETPPMPAGNEEEQLKTLYRYLVRLADDLNHALTGIGGNDLTDSERKILNGVIEKPAGDGETDDMQTLKSWIIKTAEFTQSTIEKMRKNLVSESVAKGKFGEWVRRTELNVDVTPEGITQKYSFEEMVQALQTYTVNAKNYIKTGLLRTVNNIPVYGIAVGKDIVTFAEDGTETYHDGNKVAEFTADELSFWQNGSKVAGYTGNRISFYYGGTEVFYIQNGAIYCQNDFTIKAGKTFKVLVDEHSGMNVGENGIIYLDDRKPFGMQIAPYDKKSYLHCGVYYGTNDTGTFKNSELIFEVTSVFDSSVEESDLVYEIIHYTGENAYAALRKGGNSVDTYIGYNNSYFDGAYIKIIKVDNELNSTDRLIIHPSQKSNNYGVVVTALTGSNTVRFDPISSDTQMIFKGQLEGGIKPLSVTPGNDFNSWTSAGTYIIAITSSYSNIPSDAYGLAKVDVVTDGTFVYQRISTTAAIYERFKNVSSWTNWMKYAGVAA